MLAGIFAFKACFFTTSGLEFEQLCGGAEGFREPQSIERRLPTLSQRRLAPAAKGSSPPTCTTYIDRKASTVYTLEALPPSAPHHKIADQQFGAFGALVVGFADRVGGFDLGHREACEGFADLGHVINRQDKAAFKPS
jgi:hypothetical protein